MGKNKIKIYKQIIPSINMPKKRKISEGNSSGIEDKIVENLVSLQKVHIDLAEKFDKLTKEISSLLGLFEIAARSFSKHPASKITENDKEFLEKIDKLLEQNKTIAKGLALMEDQMRKKMYHQTAPSEEVEVKGEITEEYSPSIKSNRPMPRF